MNKLLFSYRFHFIGGFICLLITAIASVLKEGEKHSQSEWTPIDRIIMTFALLGFIEIFFQFIIIIKKLIQREYLRVIIAITLTGLITYALVFLFFFLFLFMNMGGAPVDDHGAWSNKTIKKL